MEVFMIENSYDEVIEEKNPKVRELYWNVAFGLQEVDNLKPSKYMVELADEHIKGDKTYKQVQEEITGYYSMNVDTSNDEKEADDVATAIYEILSDGAFRFDYLTFKNYHKRLFQNLDYEVYRAGEFRGYNFTKKELVLDNDTVDYQAWHLIEESLKYDFEEERNVDYINFSEEELVDRIV